MAAYETPEEHDWAYQIMDLRDRFEAEHEAQEEPLIRRLRFVQYLLHMGHLSEWGPTLVELELNQSDNTTVA